MDQELWRDGEMEKCLSQPMEGLRGVSFTTTNFVELLFPVEDIDILKIYHPVPIYPNPPVIEMKKYFYAKDGAKIRLRPSADSISRFAVGLGRPDFMTTEGMSTTSVRVPGAKGMRYWLPFELLMKEPNVLHWTLFYKRPWIFYDGAWDTQTAKCIVVDIPFRDKNWELWYTRDENSLQTSGLDAEGCLNIVIRPEPEEGEP